MMEKFTYKDRYGTYEDCHFMVSTYMNQNLYISILSSKEGPITTVTVNTEYSIPHEYIAVKNYSENEGMEDWLHEMGLIEDEPTQVINHGYIKIPVYLLTPKGLEIFKR